MTLIQGIILGIVQGFTEFLPVSSSGHLTLFSALMDLPSDILFTIVVHLGTLLAELVSAYEMNAFKDEYQKAVVENAKWLAKCLADEGMDVANWASYYFDGVKAASSAFGAHNNTLILMVNVG